MSNNSALPTPKRPLTTRELLAELILRNLEAIETRTVCLLARTCAAYNTNGNQTPKSMLEALADVISAPFLRLGKQYCESPITHQITAASRKFNNLLIACKREATIHIKSIARHDVYEPTSQRKIERLGLRFPIIKIDIEELIAADEADADGAANANSETTALAAIKAAARAATTPIPTSIAQIQPPAKIPPPTPAPTPASIPATAPVQPDQPLQPTSTPPYSNSSGLLQNPNNKKNRFKKRRAA